MKIFKYIICAATLGLVITSCSDLDLDAKGIQDEATLFSSDQGIITYFAKLYNKLPIEDFNYGVSGDQPGYRSFENNQWQAQKSSSCAVSGECTGRSGSYSGAEAYDYWPYEDIRMVNNFLEQMPNYKDKYDEDTYNEYIAEARFLRAFYYFGMAKRYGGVPLITEVQEPYAPADSLNVPRATEYETWKFIYEDLKFAMENGSKVTGTERIARANRYTAAALASRAMLFAGSVAKYSQVLNAQGEAVDLGLQLMQPEQAEEFFQYAYDACKLVKEGGYKLHTGSDPEKAFSEVFTQENPGEEDIFIKRSVGAKQLTIADKMGFCNQWQAMVLPKPMSQFVGCSIQPYWDMIDLYEHPALVDENGYPVRFDNLEDFEKSPELEPRCRATYWFTGMENPACSSLNDYTKEPAYTAGIFDMRAGVWLTFSHEDGTSYLASDACQMDDQTYEPAGQRVRFNNPNMSSNAKGKIKGSDGKNYTFEPNTRYSGIHGLGMSKGDEEYGFTGAFIRKYVNESPADGFESEYNINGGTLAWKTFRYGEVLCNWAEAAYELGMIRNDESLKKEAIDHVNELRTRAGCKNMYTYNPNPADMSSTNVGYGESDAYSTVLLDENLQYIRDERARELMFENIRYWDLRRWRNGHIIFENSWLGKVLSGYYVFDEKKYIFLNEYEFRMTRHITWHKGDYYRQIPSSERNKNPLLIENVSM